MSKRAEAAALKAYPVVISEYSDSCEEYDSNECDRLVFQEGYEKAEEELTSLINRLCETILFEWEDAADLARKTLTQIKAREE